MTTAAAGPTAKKGKDARMVTVAQRRALRAYAQGRLVLVHRPIHLGQTDITTGLRPLHTTIATHVSSSLGSCRAALLADAAAIEDSLAAVE